MEFDTRAAGIAAIIAFFVSFLLGLLSGAMIGTVFLRAIVFAVVFFVLGALANVLFSKFLQPEGGNASTATGETGEDAWSALGKNVDLSVGDDDFSSDSLASSALATEESDMTLDTIAAPSAEAADEAADANAMTDVTTDAAANDFAGLDVEAADMGLAQNNAEQYNDEQEHDVSQKDGNDASADDFSLDVSGFVPGIPGIDESVSSPNEVATTPVDVSFGKKPKGEISLSDLGRDVDAKKVADGIHILLKKEEG